MANNKVVFGNQTIIDMTDATVTADDLEMGAKAYDRNGNLITGTAQNVKWHEAVNYVGRNLLEVRSGSVNIKGLLFTVNADKSITVNGTASQEVTVRFSQLNTQTDPVWKYQQPIKAGNYIYTCTPSGGSETTYNSVIGYRTSESATREAQRDIGEGVNLTFASDVRVDAMIHVKPNIPMNNVVFKPMLRLATVQDGEYEEHIDNNRELARKDALYADIKRTGYNLIEVKNSTKTVNGVTFTVNDDKSITINGTASGGRAEFVIETDKALENGSKLILSGGVDGSLATYNLNVVRIRKSDGNRSTFISQYFIPVSIEIDNDDYLYEFRLLVENGCTANNQTCKPMLHDAAYGFDLPYQPYSMTNLQLTEKVGKLDERLSVNTNIITDLNDEAQITKHFVKNGVVFLPILGSTLNQPEDRESWGVLFVYFGGDTNSYMMELHSSRNAYGTEDYGDVYIRVRNFGGFRPWRKVTMTTITQ